MRSPTSVKYVQQVIGHLVALSRLISCAGDKGLKKKIDGTKGLCEELPHEILCSCHTMSQSNTKKTPSSMVYGED